MASLRNTAKRKWRNDGHGVPGDGLWTGQTCSSIRLFDRQMRAAFGENITLLFSPAEGKGCIVMKIADMNKINS